MNDFQRSDPSVQRSRVAANARGAIREEWKRACIVLAYYSCQFRTGVKIGYPTEFTLLFPTSFVPLLFLYMPIESGLLFNSQVSA